MTYATTQYRPGLLQRIGDVLINIRDWLDGHGRGAWLAVIIAGFILGGPLGLLVLFYVLGTGRLTKGCAARTPSVTRSTGNAAFDAYRDETLKRLEDEHREFMAFLQRLREAKDKAEFDQFMENRGDNRGEAD